MAAPLMLCNLAVCLEQHHHLLAVCWITPISILHSCTHVSILHAYVSPNTLHRMAGEQSSESILQFKNIRKKDNTLPLQLTQRPFPVLSLCKSLNLKSLAPPPLLPFSLLQRTSGPTFRLLSGRTPKTKAVPLSSPYPFWGPQECVLLPIISFMSFLTRM